MYWILQIKINLVCLKWDYSILFHLRKIKAILMLNYARMGRKFWPKASAKEGALG